ncbi:ROK family transcriptional regulator [Qiania dongpingensis]|uniref:ROK family transcriptional regulator n=1 Tax=Qiania dongpingensis TaxID=2763669 RepID=A0A7G9G2Z2_9FIRM|nr:ROK family transcriptional regulator [Qiania dongpingensis]QNM05174.1 ROK family transcriptional regulator [Qiania dongpingensis]
MEQKISNAETKRLNKIKIAKYIYHHGEASKQEIAADLGFSMPTVLQRVKELSEEGVLVEAGEYESTGGRKAKALSIAADIRYAVGLDITRNHISFVLLDVSGKVRYKKRLRSAFEDGDDYYRELGIRLEEFLDACRTDRKRILGVGISIPGIVDEERRWMTQSHVLRLEEFDLGKVSAYIPYETSFRNDANSAAYAELRGIGQNTIYLSLSNTVGGAIYIDGDIYKGGHFRSAEFGHMILVPGGTPCYCGKKGCMDSYCSARALAKWAGDDLDAFFQGLEHENPVYQAAWRDYLGYLAIAITNLRMAFDCDVILGGYVGGYMDRYLGALEDNILEYQIFESDQNYVRTGRYKHEAAAIGAGIRFVEEYFDSL